MRFQGQSVIITGGGGKIGKATRSATQVEKRSGGNGAVFILA